MTDKYSDTFHEMRDQMAPSSELLSTLNARLAVDGETPQPDAGHAATAHKSRPVAVAIGVRTDAGKPGIAGKGTDKSHSSTGSSATRRRGLGVISGSAVSLVLAGLMLVSGVTGAAAPTLTQGEPPVAAPSTSGREDASLPGADSYAAIAAAISRMLTASSGGFSYSGDGSPGTFYYSSGTSDAVFTSDTSGGVKYTIPPTDSYSQTNTQVAGIDEGDIVKTNGDYLYIATGRTIKIVRADGGDSALVSTINTSELATPDDTLTGPVMDMMITDDTLIVEVHAFNADLDNWSASSGSYLGMEATSLKTAVYSLADPSAPTLMSVSSQSGSYQTSRLLDGVVYIVTTYSVPTNTVDIDDPTTFVPLVGDGTTTRPIEPADVYVMPAGGYWPVYSVITAVNGTSGVLMSELSVFGGSETVYMSRNNMYLATTNWNYIYADTWTGGVADDEYMPEMPTPAATSVPAVEFSVEPSPAAEPGTDTTVTATIPYGVPTSEPTDAPTRDETAVPPTPPSDTSEPTGFSTFVIEPTAPSGWYTITTTVTDEPTPFPITYSGPTTTLIRVALNEGHPSVVANGEVPGSLLNQFALDEWEGNLRVVATWEDPSGYSWTQVPSLWVLDPSMKAVGSIERLTTREQVQSVRFVESLGYVVTYESIDPLFAIDLSDPTKPVVQSELKVPGFSSYLHPFGDGLLLGVGQETDPTNGATTGVKVSMFDITNPLSVTQIAVSVLEGVDETGVAFDHKSAFVDAERGLIGFPTIDWRQSVETNNGITTTSFSSSVNYVMYSWNGQTFTRLATVELNLPESFGELSALVRGVRVGDNFYVATPATVGVYRLIDFSQLTQVRLG
ncbi:MAG: beta-propeller domain-containing protein [Propionibacteriaceae bacterium]|jgi:uncharacterized secreted protein with C-terminal beta-propeller domain|nr:beta-propeller domain-containing protein [Propionibacteriaceae bacterium]